MPLHTLEGVIDTATQALKHFPRLRTRVRDEVVQRSVRGAWPEPPPPLLFLLFVAGSDLRGREGAEIVLTSLDQILALVERTDAVSGAWQSRVNRLLPPRKGGDFLDHYANFQSALFELVLAFRLLARETKVTLQGEGVVTVCDLGISRRGQALLGVEAYAPRKWSDEIYERQVASPWRVLLGESPAAPVEPSRPVRDPSTNLHAVAEALSDILTSSNFEVKRRQLASGNQPTLLAVRGYGLTRRAAELAVVAPPLELAGRIRKEAWERLPSRCLGLLLSYLGDVLKVNGRPSPVAFIPAPGRVLPSAMWDYLDSADMLTTDVIAVRDLLLGT